MVQLPWETVWQILKILTVYLSYNSVITFWGIYLKEMRTYVYTKTCTKMLTAVSFASAKNWKQSKSPPPGEGLNKLKYMCTMEYYSAIKRDKLLIQQSKWISKALWLSK
ncbi:LIN1 transcriptase, partial [Crocuta crocuta]